MNISLSINSILGFIGFVTFAWIVLSIWPKLVVDFTRQYLFEKRDYLFDLAVNEKLSFDSKEYKETRLILNAMIRMAEHATILNYARYDFILKKNREKNNLKDNHLASIINSKNTSEIIKRTLTDSINSYNYLLILRSPFIIVLIPLFLIWVLFRYSMNKKPLSDLKRKRDISIQADLNRELSSA